MVAVQEMGAAHAGDAGADDGDFGHEEGGRKVEEGAEREGMKNELDAQPVTLTHPEGMLKTQCRLRTPKGCARRNGVPRYVSRMHTRVDCQSGLINNE